jgi:hypothetical protein
MAMGRGGRGLVRGIVRVGWRLCFRLSGARSGKCEKRRKDNEVRGEGGCGERGKRGMGGMGVGEDYTPIRRRLRSQEALKSNIPALLSLPTHTSHHITQITNTEREEDKDKMRNTTKYLIFITIIGDLLLLLCCSRERYIETTNDVMTSLHLRLSSCLL